MMLLQAIISPCLLLVSAIDAICVAATFRDYNLHRDPPYGPGPSYAKVIKDAISSLLLFIFTYWWIYSVVGDTLSNICFFIICILHFYVMCQEDRGGLLLAIVVTIFCIVMYIRVILFIHTQMPEITRIVALSPFILIGVVVFIHLLNEE